MEFEQTHLLARLVAIEGKRVDLGIAIESLREVEGSLQQEIRRVAEMEITDGGGDYSPILRICRDSWIRS